MKAIWHGGPHDGQLIHLPEGAHEVVIPDPAYRPEPIDPGNPSPTATRLAAPIRVPLRQYVNSQGGVELRADWTARTPR